MSSTPEIIFLADLPAWWWRQIRALPWFAPAAPAVIGLTDPATPPRARLRIPASLALIRRLTLPQAAGADLPGIAANEIDRLTPFTAAEVHADATILHHDRVARRIVARLAVVPRSAIDPHLARLRQAGVTVEGIDIDVPGERCASIRLPVPRARRAPWFAAAALAALPLLMPVYLQSRALTQVERRLAALDAAAGQYTSLSHAMREQTARSAFLGAQRDRAQGTLRVLLALTQALPDDAYVDQLALAGNALDLQAYAADVDATMARLRRIAPLRDLRRSGAVVQNPNSTQASFAVTAQVRL